MSENNETVEQPSVEEIAGHLHDLTHEHPSAPREGDVVNNPALWDDLREVFTKHFGPQGEGQKRYHATIVVAEGREGLNPADPETVTEENIAEEAVIISQNLVQDAHDAVLTTVMQLRDAADQFEAHAVNPIEALLSALFGAVGGAHVQDLGNGTVMVSGKSDGSTASQEDVEALAERLGLPVTRVVPNEALDFEPAFDL